MSVIGAKGGAAVSYEIGHSLRFRASASAYLTRTAGAPTSQRIGTLSIWIKRGVLSTALIPILAADKGSSYDQIGFGAGDTIEFITTAGTTQVATTAVFRDPSAWYHFVFAWDTTQATAANRVKIYCNGAELTHAGGPTYPALNRDMSFSASGITQYLMRRSGAATYNDCHAAETYFIDGQALTPSSFGETNGDGVWVPKKYTGTYGNNGFYLDFSDGTSTTTLGYDAAGSNDWTCNNISLTAGVTYDWMVDTPTNNYATLTTLPITPYPAALARGNLQLTTTSGVGGGNAYGTIAIPDSGKWYFETVALSLAANLGVGISTYLASQSYAYQAVDGVFYFDTGSKVVDNSSSGYGATWAASDVIGMAIDVGASSVTFYKNNSSQGAISHACAGRFVSFSDGSSGAITSIADINFGQRPFAYTPPTGFQALCTANLPTVTITKPNKHFDVVTRTGTGATYTKTGLQFQPDLAWIKTRSTSGNHSLYDSVRGIYKGLFTALTVAEESTTDSFTAFNSDGYSLGANALGTYPQVNVNTTTYVDWLWKAGGTGVSNSDGSITSTVSANQTAGFSIVTYTGTGANATVGHGLGVAPKLIIVKQRTTGTVENWAVYNANLANTEYLLLNTTAAKATGATYWNSTTPTSTVFNIGSAADTNESTKDFVAYCFAEIPGFSKFGSYTGNGSADGPFVYCGFRPKYVMVKASSGTGNWSVFDSVRDDDNAVFAGLFPNLANAEYTAVANYDFTSNGFKLRIVGPGDNNTNGVTYIFAAFAEHPFGGSNVSPAPAR